MSDQQKKNLIIFVLMLSAGGYYLHANVLTKQQLQIAGLKKTLADCDEKLQALANLRTRVAQVKSVFQGAEQTVQQIQAAFPKAVTDKSQMALELTGLPEEVGGVELRNQPPVKITSFVYTSSQIQEESMTDVHKNLIVPGMAALSLPGRTVIPKALGVSLMTQELQVVGDYKNVVTFLSRLSGLKFMYDTLALEIWQDFSDPANEKRVEAKVTVGTFVLADYPVVQ